MRSPIDSCFPLTRHGVAMRKKVQTTVYLEDEQHETLKAMSRATKVPYAIYVREGVARIIKEAKERGIIQ